MSNYYAIRYDNSYLVHHGILGMRWGVRRYQNKDGSLTAAGRNRYGIKSTKEYKNERIEKYKKEGYGGLAARKRAFEDTDYSKRAFRMANSGRAKREKIEQQLLDGSIKSELKLQKKWINARTKELAGLTYASMVDEMAPKVATYYRSLSTASFIGQILGGLPANFVATAITGLAVSKITGIDEFERKVRAASRSQAEREYNNARDRAVQKVLKGN